MLGKKELFVSSSLEEIRKRTDILIASNIKYRIKTIANDGADFSFFTTFIGSSRRSRGSFNEKSDLSKTYSIYVSKDSYEEAKYLINSR